MSLKLRLWVLSQKKQTKENALIESLPVNQKLCIVRSVIQTPLLRKFQLSKKWSPTGPRYGEIKL